MKWIWRVIWKWDSISNNCCDHRYVTMICLVERMEDDTKMQGTVMAWMWTSEVDKKSKIWAAKQHSLHAFFVLETIVLSTWTSNLFNYLVTWTAFFPCSSLSFRLFAPCPCLETQISLSLGKLLAPLKFLHRHSDFVSPSQVARPYHREGMDHAQLAQRLLQISESSCGLSEYLLRRLKDFMRSRRDESGTRMKWT